jgi:hypothetical protein
VTAAFALFFFVEGRQMAAYTAASKFLIGALRDEHAEHEISNNNSVVAAAAQEVSRAAVAILSDEAVPLKNLGALYQHLMNSVTDPAEQVGYMRKMVQTYRRFVALSRSLQARSHTQTEDSWSEEGEGEQSKPEGETWHLKAPEPDPDVEILDKWVGQVVEWMLAQGHQVESDPQPITS